MRVGMDVRWLSFPKLIGYTRYIYCLLQELQKYSGIELSLFTTMNQPVHEVYQDDIHMPVIELPCPREILWEQFYLPRALKQHDIDVYHAPADIGLPVGASCKRVITSHGVTHDLYFKYMLSVGQLKGNIEDYIGDMIAPPPKTLGQWYRKWRHQFINRLYPRTADGIIAVSH